MGRWWRIIEKTAASLALAGSRRREMEMNSWRVGLMSILNPPGLDWERVILEYTTERFKCRFVPSPALLLLRDLWFLAVSGKKQSKQMMLNYTGSNALSYFSFMAEVDEMSVEIYLKFSLNIFNKIMICWFQSNWFLNLFGYLWKPGHFQCKRLHTSFASPRFVVNGIKPQRNLSMGIKMQSFFVCITHYFLISFR